MMSAARNLILVQKIFREKDDNILIPEIARKTYSGFEGKVISIGPEFPFKDEVKINDIVIFSQNEGVPVSQEVVALSPDRVLAVCPQEVGV